MQLLSKREYSRIELARKLAQTQAPWRSSQVDGELTELPKPVSASEVAEVLDDLERQGFLNDARFALSLVHRKSQKLGAARVLRELTAHQLDAQTTGELTTQLKASEQSRCDAAWRNRFGHHDLAGLDSVAAQAAWAKQMRFLQARGFAHEAIRSTLKQAKLGQWTHDSSHEA